MKFLVFFSLIISSTLWGQEQIYDPQADAEKDIEKALTLAQEENKNIIVQVGGNWCSWCLLFNKYIHEEPKVASFIDQNFVYYHLNFSRENKNEKILEKYDNPQKLGFPVLLILDSSGKLLHTQETGSLENGKWYDTPKVMEFLSNYAP